MILEGGPKLTCSATSTPECYKELLFNVLGKGGKLRSPFDVVLLDDLRIECINQATLQKAAKTLKALWHPDPGFPWRPLSTCDSTLLLLSVGTPAGTFVNLTKSRCQSERSDS